MAPPCRDVWRPADLDEGWHKVKTEGIDRLTRLMNEGFKGPAFSNTESMQVYHTVYRMCTQRAPYNFSEQLYARHNEVRPAAARWWWRLLGM